MRDRSPPQRLGRIAANRAGALRESGSRRRHFAAVGFTCAQNRDSENRENADGNSPGFAAAAIADALKNPGKPSRQPAAAPAPDSLVDSLAAQLEIERSRNAELMEALAAERDRAARAEAEAKAQLAEANARVAELAGKLASLAERQQAIAATPWWRRGRMAMKLLGPGRQE